MRILAISGKRGAGKDMLADFLVRSAPELFGYPAIKRGLADPIKYTLACYFCADPSVLWGANKQKEALIPGCQMTYRDAMRKLGESFTRIKPLVFVDVLMKFAETYPGVVIINDMRLAQEAHALKFAGAKIIRLTHAENPDDTHITETSLDAWDGFDAVIDNRKMLPAHVQQHTVKLLHHWGWLREDFQW